MSQTATTSADVRDDHVEMEPDEVSSEVLEMNSADALVENTAIDDKDCFTDLNDVVTNYNGRYLCVQIHVYSFFCVVILCHRYTKVSFLCTK